MVFLWEVLLGVNGREDVQSEMLERMDWLGWGSDTIFVLSLYSRGTIVY